MWLAQIAPMLPDIPGPWGFILSAAGVVLATVAVEMRGRWADKRNETKSSLKGLIEASDIITDNLREEVTRLVTERRHWETERQELLNQMRQMENTVRALENEVHALRAELDYHKALTGG